MVVNTVDVTGVPTVPELLASVAVPVTVSVVSETGVVVVKNVSSLNPLVNEFSLSVSAVEMTVLVVVETVVVHLLPTHTVEVNTDVRGVPVDNDESVVKVSEVISLDFSVD